MCSPSTSHQSFDQYFDDDAQPQAPVLLEGANDDVDSRFADLTEEQLKSIEDGRNSAKTKSLTAWSVGLLEQFIAKRAFKVYFIYENF